jgi:phage terminase small subunit
MARGKKEGRGLTPLQQKFALEYAVDFNAKQAALRAGYKPGAARGAWRLVKHPEIAKLLGKSLEERRKRAIVTADRVLREYARIAFADIRRFAEWDPEKVKVRPVSAFSDDDAAAVAELSAGTGRGTRIKLHDKQRALDAIVRHLGLFDPRQTAGDPKAREEAAQRARDKLSRRIGVLADGEEEK